MGLLGLNFGLSKSKSQSTINKTEDTTQNKLESTNSTQNTSSNTSQQTNSSGSTTSNQAGTQTTAGTKVNQQTGATSLFGNDILSGLEGSVKNLLGTVTPTSLKASTFNPETFVNDTMRAAQAQTQSGLDATLGGIGDMIGAANGNSSMGTLLANRATSDAASTVAGVRSQAEQTAQGIVNADKQIQLASGSQGMDMLTQLLAQLKGGQQVTTQAGTEGTTGSSTSNQTGSTTTNESSSQNTQTQAMQTIQQLVDALLTGSTKTTGTESTKGSGMTAGANLSVGK